MGRIKTVGSPEFSVLVVALRNRPAATAPRPKKSQKYM